jgi:hypothetical protein
MTHDLRRSGMLLAAAGVLGGAFVTGGCAKARAAREPELPPLAMPAPPPRVLPPLEGGPIEAAVSEQQPETPEQRRPPARHRAESARADSQRIAREDQVRPETQAGNEVSAPPPEAPPEPAAPALQLAPSPDAASEQGIRRQLVRANTDLGKVDYRALNDDAKAQYETAKRFIELADQSIRDRNLVFAQTLADKAAAIAEVLRR